ncbi:unnamed protein product [Polarella glacialis]|uniref:Uncharacterized protein n=1 Tax=Polarella glacialis TaxID=89957 RepID=A0A813DYW2_POLGL|nr:unnamed protein product [Polarella glacialis]CAE8632700.1 unnamed protein product [Polarella glacialis]CAE8694342.1 unnamed protein product [Polarella glacialis]
MAPVYRCGAKNRHLNWQTACDKARGVQLGEARPLEPLPPVKWFDQPRATLEELLIPGRGGSSACDSASLAASMPSRVAWFPKGSAHGQNNRSLMVNGVVSGSNWHLSGGIKTSHTGFFGAPRRSALEIGPWQQELAALRTSRSTSLPSLPRG